MNRQVSQRIKSHFLKLKNIVVKIEFSGLDLAEKRIGKLEDRFDAVTQNVAQGDEKMKVHE